MTSKLVLQTRMLAVALVLLFSWTTGVKASTVTDVELLPDSGSIGIDNGRVSGAEDNGSIAGNGSVSELYFYDNSGLPFGRDITLADIASINYYTKKPTDQGAQDWFIKIYTQPNGVDDQASWYGYRIAMEPYFSVNINAPADQWNQWSTDAGDNQLRIFDSSANAYFGAYTDPTLADLQAGPVTCNGTTAKDYRNEIIKYMVIGTGSGWAADFTGAFDDLTLTLKDGAVLDVSASNGKPVKNVNSGAFYSTIQAAVTAAAAGDTIQLAAGTYDGYLSLTKSLTLLGANAGVHPVVGTHKTETVGVRGAETIFTGTINPQADDITIDGITIDSGTRTRVIDTYVDSDGFVFRNNIFINDSAYAQQGVMQFGGGNHTGCVFEFNDFRGGETAMLYTGGDFTGLALRYNKFNCKGNAVFWTAQPLVNGVIQGNEFDGTIEGVPGVGPNTVNIGQAGNLQILDNYVHDVPYTAFQVGIVGGLVQGNRFENVYPYASNPALYGGYGLDLFGGAWNTALSADTEIIANTFVYNTSADGPVRAIRFAGPANAGDPAIDASTINIHDNVFINANAYAGTVAVRHQGDQTTEVDLSANYWGTVPPNFDALVQGAYKALSYYADAELTDLRYPNVYVNASYDVATDGWGQYAFSTIQSAVSAASLGATVNVAVGTYVEQVRIRKQVTILGSNAGISAGAVPGTRNAETIIDGGFYIGKDGDPAAFTVIDGLTIRNGYQNGSHRSGVVVVSTDVKIKNNIIEACIGNQEQAIETTPGANNLLIENNEIVNNWRGVFLNPANGIVINGNAIHGNNGSGVGIGSDGQSNITVIGNKIYDHTIEGWGMGTLGAGSVANKNTFMNNGVSIAHYSGVAIDATRNYFGAENPDFATILGGSVVVSPWYADAAMTQLRYSGNNTIQDTQTIGRGQTVTVPDVLTVGDATNPAKLTVNGGTLNVGTLNLVEGSVLDVINGELVLGTIDGGSHTMAGTFTIYNSFGSVYIEDDTEFSGATLALISDIHVSPGKTLTVSGALTWDGCRVDSTTPGSSFNVMVTETGTFKMVRTELTDAVITLAGVAAELRDNLLSDVTIAVAAEATDNRIFHNVFLANVDLTDAGTDTVTTFDGWGNVASLAETKNNLTAELKIGALDTTRTLDAGGNLYVQPGDIVRVNLDVGALTKKITGVEAMLGFNTDFFSTEAPSALSLVAPWLEEFPSTAFGADGVYGKLDAGIGLSINYEDPVGTDDNGTVATIDLGSQADAPDGVTKFYFRTRQTSDNAQATTRLSGFDGETDYELLPFTLNTGLITVDGTAPEIDSLTAAQVQGMDTVDVFGETITHQGTVTFTVDAFDATAGIDIEDVIVTVTYGEPAVEMAVVQSTVTESVVYEVEGEQQAWTRYTFTVLIDENSPTGIYSVKADVADRSGNVSVNVLENTFEFDRRFAVTVALQGAEANSFTRDVTFFATDESGTVLAPTDGWIGSVEFTDGVGTTTLSDVPVGMAHLSAKTSVSLRRRIDATLGVEGQGAASFTGTGDEGKQLLGGDLNEDNVVNMTDYNRLRYYWYTENAVADIDGDGASAVTDLNILKANWYMAGDPQ